jgi:hypothetical protein
MSAGAAASLADALTTASVGRRLLYLGGATGDWFLIGSTALRLPEYLAEVANQLGLGMILYERGRPPEELLPHGRAPIAGLRLPRESDPANVVPELLRLAEDEQHALLVCIEGIENLLPDAESPISNPEDLDLLERFQRLPMSTAYSFGKSVVVLVERAAPVHHRLRQSPGVYEFAIPLPNLAERRSFMELSQAVPSDDIERTAEVTAGLTLDESRFLAVTSASEADGVVPTIMRRKAEMLRTACPNLELMQTPVGLSHLAGMDALKERIRIAMERDRVPPMIIFVGPPGTGKTFGAKALAHELGRPMAQLHMMNSPYVGENERVFRVARLRITSMGHVIVWIDEIDQQLVSRDSGPQGDSGTSNRLMASLLEWTGDPASQDIILVGATNRPDRMDNALNDRTRMFVPFLHATPRQLLELIPEIARQAGLTLDPGIDLSGLVSHHALRAVSGRQVHDIIERAGEEAWSSGRNAITNVDLGRALDGSTTMPGDRDRYWTLLALQYTSDDRLFPWAGLEVVQPQDVPFLARDFVGDTGELDRDRLEQEVEQYRRRYG